MIRRTGSEEGAALPVLQPIHLKSAKLPGSSYNNETITITEKTMVELDRLLLLPGALAAFKFSDRGELIEHQVAPGSVMTDAVLDLISHVCVANLSIATMQARGWEAMTGMTGFYPVQGFTVVGMDWSTVIQGQHGVVLENGKADFQAAYAALNA